MTVRIESRIIETFLESELHRKISDQDKVLRLKSFLIQREALMGIKLKKRNQVRHAYYVE